MYRHKLKQLIGLMYPRSNRLRKIILLYHSIGESPWALSVKQFKEQIAWLSEHYQICSLENLLHSPLKSQSQVCITFDDGYESLFKYAAPILEKYKLSATVYLNTGMISQDDRTRCQSNVALGHYPSENFLTWQEVKYLLSAGWLIGSHGVNHVDFSSISQLSIRDELSRSKNDVEMNLQIQCDHFAYPWGKHSALVKQMLSVTGYKYAAAACFGTYLQGYDNYQLPRINIPKQTTLKDFKAMIQGKWDYLKLAHKIKGQ